MGVTETAGSRADEAADRTAIRDVVESWAVWRDAGDWDRLRQCWHPGGRMIATWTESTVDEFIELSRGAWARGVNVLHFLGGLSVELRGRRAVSQCKMTISQRSLVEGVLCDVTATGRFYDMLDKRANGWAIVLRQCIYEKDRLEPVQGPPPVLDAALLQSFPEGYRHLAYLQMKSGLTVRNHRPGRIGPEVEAVYQQGRLWLDGGLPDTVPATSLPPS